MCDATAAPALWPILAVQLHLAAAAPVCCSARGVLGMQDAHCSDTENPNLDQTALQRNSSVTAR